MARLTIGPMLAGALALTLLHADSVAAQRASPVALPEPLLRETPWGDFPLERLLPGARLRFTDADGHQLERQVVALRDSTLELRTSAGDPLPAITFGALRQFRRIEVHAIPQSAGRASTASLVGGALLGALVAPVIHNNRSPSGRAVHGLFGDIAGFAVIGGLVGWEIGIHTVGGPHWVRVTLP